MTLSLKQKIGRGLIAGSIAGYLSVGVSLAYFDQQLNSLYRSLPQECGESVRHLQRVEKEINSHCLKNVENKTPYGECVQSCLTQYCDNLVEQKSSLDAKLKELRETQEMISYFNSQDELFIRALVSAPFLLITGGIGVLLYKKREEKKCILKEEQ